MRILPLAVLLCGAYLLCLATAISISDVPQCALQCAFQSLREESTALGNTSGMCKKKKLAEETKACVDAACSVGDSLEFSRLVLRVCDTTVEDSSQEFAAVVIIFATLSIVFVVLRMVSKMVSSSPWGPDDSWAIVTFVIMIASTVFALVGGNSKRLRVISKDVSNEISRPYFEGISSSSCPSIFIWQILFICGLATAKTSILFFYLRIFPDEKFRLVTWITIAFNAVSSMVIGLVMITKGHTITSLFEGKSYKMTIEEDLTVLRITLAHSVVNFAVDVWMLILPMTQIYNLGLRTNKKIRVMAMFGVGFFLTAVTMARVILQAKAIGQDVQTGTTTYAILVLSCLELYVGLAVACAPSAQQLFHIVLEKIYRKGQRRSKSRKSKLVFVDRSLAPISEDDVELVLSDIGDLISGTAATTSLPEKERTVDPEEGNGSDGTKV